MLANKPIFELDRMFYPTEVRQGNDSTVTLSASENKKEKKNFWNILFQKKALVRGSSISPYKQALVCHCGFTSILSVWLTYQQRLNGFKILFSRQIMIDTWFRAYSKYKVLIIGQCGYLLSVALTNHMTYGRTFCYYELQPLLASNEKAATTIQLASQQP